MDASVSGEAYCCFLALSVVRARVNPDRKSSEKRAHAYSLLPDNIVNVRRLFIYGEIISAGPVFGAARKCAAARGSNGFMANVVVVGSQWGDEGKGKIV
ncbi:MAG: adenylosuccinate synthetase, partial [Rhodobiaceae bacterium]|nr:adenylosuccinate synthetase [Rhodobiaceae bacterium]